MLEDLTRVCLPPSSPSHTGSSRDWQNVEMRFGLSFPEDYKACLDKYGAGSFAGFLNPLNPFLMVEGYEFTQHIREILETYDTIRKELPGETYPFTIYPEKNGLFPVSVTDNGDIFYWATIGCSSGWPIIIYDGRHSQFETHHLSYTDLVTKWLRGELQTNILPPSPRPIFIKYEDVFGVTNNGNP